MKKKFLLLCILILNSVYLEASDGDFFIAKSEEGIDITFVIQSEENHTVKVGNSSSSAIDITTVGTVTIPLDVEYNGHLYSVNTISTLAFNGCSEIEIIKLHNNITNIGKNAFYNCSKLKSINLPKDITSIPNYTFYGCSSLETIEIPEKVKSIGQQAFNGCSSLKTVNFPEGLVSIGNQSFRSCSALTTLIFPSTLTKIDSQAFYQDKKITRVTANMEIPFSFGKNAFFNISSICGLHVPEGKKEAYIEAGWTKAVFGGGIVEGDETPTIGTVFVLPNNDGVEITYKVVDVDNMIVSVGNGSSHAITSEKPASLTIPSEIIFLNKTYSVGSIANKAFSGDNTITNIIISDGIKNIGENTFSDCQRLVNIVLPSTLVNVGKSAFQGCNTLDNIFLPESIESLGTSVFSGCISLKSINIPSSLTEIPDYAFNGSGLQLIEIPSNIVKIGLWAFASCKQLSSVKISESVVSLGASVFRECSSLTKVNLPSELKTIPKSCFESCTQLFEVGIPDNLETIGENAFWQCTSLENITIPETVKTIGKQAFRYCPITSISIPEGVTSIGDVTFGDCYYLKRIIIPSTITTIGKEAFRHCMSLEEIYLPEGITTIGNLTFYNCQSIRTITLPSTLISCGTSVFLWCSNLNKVIARMDDPFQQPEGMFENCSTNISLHIPDDTYDKYIAAGWTPDKFPGGIVYGDDTPTLNEKFTFTTIEGVEVTAVLTDIEKKTIQVGQGTSGNPAIDQATQGIVTLPDTVEAFGNKYVITTIGGYAFRYCNDVTEVKIPATVTHIGRYGFGNMDNLEKAVLPDSLIAMETAAFYKDEKLSEVVLNEGLQDIGNYAFSYAAIRELEIPATVTNIGRNSFAACGELDKVISRIETAYAFQDGAFAQISGTCGLHVPEGTKEAYIEQGWTEETFPGGIVYGDETLHKGQSFDVTEEDGTQKTFRVTDVNEMKAEMVSVKAGSEAGGTVTLMPTATHELTGNVYTLSSIADKAFGADVKKVLSRIETPFAASSAAFASLSPMCSLHVPAGTKAAYLENGWTEESFKAGVVEGDDTLVKGQTFTLTDEDGTSTTYRVTDVNDNLVEIVSAKEGEESDGRVSIQQAVTDPVAGNDYTVGSIGNGAFNENLKAVTAEAETPYPVTPEAFKGIGDKCVLFVPAGTKDAYIENGWTEDIFKGGIYEGNIPGDVNEDLAVDISDIVAVINTIADPEGSAYRYADVNEDGKVDISDIVKIINIIAEK